jgi:trimeric autotransporter adhesin
MKKLSLLLALIYPAMLFAQSVAINTDASAPDNTAILDIKSNTKGLLIPRLTTAERTAIVSPAVGLTVFDSNTFT